MIADQDSETILFSTVEIGARVAELARVLARGAYKPELAVPVLAGAFMFAADLLRALAAEGLDLETEFIWLRAYGRMKTASEVTVLQPPTDRVRGRACLLIDGVLESGATLARAKALLEAAGAASIASVVAVKKPFSNPAFMADHVGFTAGAEFLYGYGMDADGKGRGLPDIRVQRNLAPGR